MTTIAVQVVNHLVLVPRIKGGAVDFTSAQTVLLLAIAGSLAGSLGLIFVLPTAGMARQIVVYADARLDGATPGAAATFAARRLRPSARGGERIRDESGVS